VEAAYSFFFLTPAHLAACGNASPERKDLIGTLIFLSSLLPLEVSVGYRHGSQGHNKVDRFLANSGGRWGRQNLRNFQ
jgi:hypothetical protein